MLDFWSFDFTDPANQGWTTGGLLHRSTTVKPYGTYSAWLNATGVSVQSPSFGNIATSYVGTWYLVTSLASLSPILQMLDGSTIQVSVTAETDGSVKIRRGGNAGTVLATSAAGVIVANTWAHWQLAVVYHGSTGSVELRKNGTTVVASASGVNTISTANLYANKIQLSYSSGFSISPYWKGLWVSDQGFQGACQTEVLYPNGVGSSSNFTPSGAATGWQATDDPGENDGDSTYAAGVNVGDTDTYAMGNMAATTGTIKAVKSNNNWRTDAGARSGARVIRIGSTNYVGATISANASYTVVGEVLTQSPATSAAWTIAEINGMEHGAKVAA